MAAVLGSRGGPAGGSVAAPRPPLLEANYLSCIQKREDFFLLAFVPFLKFAVYTPKSSERQRHFQRISLRSDGTQPRSTSVGSPSS